MVHNVKPAAAVEPAAVAVAALQAIRMHMPASKRILKLKEHPPNAIHVTQSPRKLPGQSRCTDSETGLKGVATPPDTCPPPPRAEVYLDVSGGSDCTSVFSTDKIHSLR
jgi:hypothetical protein